MTEAPWLVAYINPSANSAAVVEKSKLLLIDMIGHWGAIPATPKLLFDFAPIMPAHAVP